jgi:hypothetical protein
MLVRRFDTVTRVASFVERNKELLGVPVQSALSRLVGVHLNECVVTTFLSHTELQSAKVTLEGPRPCSVTGALHPDFREKIIRDAKHIRWGKLSSEKMTHIEGQVPGSLAGCTV